MNVRIPLFILLCVSMAAGQTIRGTLDARNARATYPDQTGTLANRPSICGIGQKYFTSDQSPNVEYNCIAANTWALGAGGNGSVGPAGPTGPTGAAGYSPQYIVASGAPGSGAGNNGDMYINSATGDVYGPKASGAWGSIAANIKGPAGPTGATGATGPTGGAGASGPTGPAGSTGATGATGAAGYSPQYIVAAGLPSSGTGNNGDMYINSATGDVYGPKTTGAWGAIAANIKGPTGATGATGAAGPAGSTGPTGPAGPIAGVYTSPLFTSQTSVTVLGSAHNFASAGLLISAYDNSTPRNLLPVSSVTISPSSYNVVVTFASAQTGYIVVNGGVGATGATGAAGSTGAAGVVNQIQNNGVSVTQRGKLNFAPGTNTTVSLTDNGTDTTTVTVSSTAGMSKQGFYLYDGTNYYTGSNFIQATLPTIPTFTAGNLGTNSWVTSNNAKVLSTAVGTTGLVLEYLSYTAPKTLIIGWMQTTAGNSRSVNEGGCGPVWFDGTKSEAISYTGTVYTISGQTFAAAMSFNIDNWTTLTTYGSQRLAGSTAFAQGVIWLKLNDDGANLNISFSADGANWQPYYTETYASSLFGASPGKIGFGCQPSNGTNAMIGTLLSWSLQ